MKSLAVFALLFVAVFAARDFRVDLLGSTNNPSRIFNNNGLSSIAYDKDTQRVFATNVGNNSIDVFDLKTPSHPGFIGSYSLAAYGSFPTTVAVAGSVVAIAVVPSQVELAGTVVIVDGLSLSFKRTVQVGPYPSDLAFTSNDLRLVVTNQGKPNQDYSQDPEGSVSIVELIDDNLSVPFTRDNLLSLTSDFKVSNVNLKAISKATKDTRIRHYTDAPSDPTLAEDLEPIAVEISPLNNLNAYVLFQSNNAIAELQLVEGNFTFTHIYGLDNRNFSIHGFDGSRTDGNNGTGAINIARWPAFGLLEPASFSCFVSPLSGVPHCATANGGTARQYSTYDELVQINDIFLNNETFDLSIQNDTDLGELSISSLDADLDGDGIVDVLLVPGGRSYSIIDMASRKQIYESGDVIEKLIEKDEEENFNSNNIENESFDQASIWRGPEPAAVVVGVIQRVPYMFLALKEQGGFIFAEIANHTTPEILSYQNNRDFSNESLEFEIGDLGPTDIIFISSDDSSTGEDLVLIANTVSSSLTVYRVERLDETPIAPMSIPQASASTLSSLFSLLVFSLAILFLF